MAESTGRIASIGILVAAPIAVGFAIAALPFDALIVGGIAVSLLVATAWLVVSFRDAARSVRMRASEGDDGGTYESSALKLARGLFYLGVLTIAFQVFRVKGFAISDYLFGLSVLMAGVGMLSSGLGVPRAPLGIFLGVSLYVVGAAVSTHLNAFDRLSSYAAETQFALVATVWFISGALVLRSKRDARRAVFFWAASVGICSCWAIGQKLGVAPVFSADVTGRLGGLMEHPNALGAITGITLMPVLALLLTSRNSGEKVLLIGVFAVSIIALGMSGSISGAVGAMAGLAVGLTSPRTTAIVGLTLLMAAAIGAYAIRSGNAAETQIGRFSTATSETAGFGQGSLKSRVDVYDQAWSRIGESPLVGQGLDWRSAAIYTNTTGNSHMVHNIFLGTWYESGILGLLGVLMIFASLMRAAVGNVLHATSPDQQDLAIGLFGAMLAATIVSMAEPIRDQRFVLIPACFVVVMYAIRATEAMSARRSRSLPPVSTLSEVRI